MRAEEDKQLTLECESATEKLQVQLQLQHATPRALKPAGWPDGGPTVYRAESTTTLDAKKSKPDRVAEASADEC